MILSFLYLLLYLQKTPFFYSLYRCQGSAFYIFTTLFYFTSSFYFCPQTLTSVFIPCYFPLILAKFSFWLFFLKKNMDFNSLLHFLILKIQQKIKPNIRNNPFLPWYFVCSSEVELISIIYSSKVQFLL